MVDVEVMWKKLKATYIDLFNAHTEQVEAIQADRDHWRDLAGELAGVLRELEDVRVHGSQGLRMCACCTITRAPEIPPAHIPRCKLAAALARYDAGKGEVE